MGKRREYPIRKAAKEACIIVLVDSASNTILDVASDTLPEAANCTIPIVDMVFRVNGLMLREGEICKSLRTAVKLDRAGDRLATEKPVPVVGTTSPLVSSNKRLARRAWKIGRKNHTEQPL